MLGNGQDICTCIEKNEKVCIFFIKTQNKILHVHNWAPQLDITVVYLISMMIGPYLSEPELNPISSDTVMFHRKIN